MKSSKLMIAHEKSDFSPAEFNRVKLPQLPKSQSKAKRSNLKVSSRLESTPTKYDQLVEEIIDLQNCVSKKYGKNIRIESLRKMQKSINSLNQDLININRNTTLKTSKDAVRSTSSSDSEDHKAPTEILFKWSKRLKFNKRPEMAQKNIVVFNFEGVIGDIFSDNTWVYKPTLHLRKGLRKGLNILKQHFQIILYIKSQNISVQKIIRLFKSKGIKFDAVYFSQNDYHWNSKNPDKIKKNFKHSEYIQNYTQVAKDFSIENEELTKMLVVTSLWMDSNEAGTGLVIKNFHSIPHYFCKSVPTLSNTDNLLPITLALPDPRAAGEGDSFFSICELIIQISNLSNRTEEQSWIEGFVRIRQHSQFDCVAFETSAYQYGLFRDKRKITKAQVELFEDDQTNCICQYDIKHLCKSQNFGRCTVRNKFKSLKISGEEFPSFLLKNKFIVFKSHRPAVYKTIEGFKI